MAIQTEMEKMKMKMELYDAAIEGVVNQLVALVRQNEGILDLVTAAGDTEQSPLHIAAQFGHVAFVEKIIGQKQECAVALNSQRQTPLHLASMKGHLELVEMLTKEHDYVCLFRDENGRTPLHLAAVNGRLNVVEKLLDVKPAAAKMLTSDGEPILHLCANHKQIDAVKKLVELVKDPAFVNLKDNEDNTILHLLASQGKMKMVKFLINKGVDVKAQNIYGSTAIDVSLDNITSRFHFGTNLVLTYYGAETKAWFSREACCKKLEEKERGRNKMLNEGLLVLAVLMATVAFQAGLNPPGGVWQDTGYHNRSSGHPDMVHHTVGQSVMSYIDERNYAGFCVSNTMTLLLSLILVMLLASGPSSEAWFSRWMLVFITHASLCSMVITYLFSVHFLSTEKVLNDGALAPFPMYIIGALLVANLFLSEFLTRLLLALFKLLIWLLKFREKLSSVGDKNIRRSWSKLPSP